jgi:hypothetical protein
MADTDALKDFQFPKNKGLFTTFEDGDEFKIRVLTTDPVVSTKEFEGADGEINISTKFAFVVYNWTVGKAQILNAGATITKAIQKLHQDEEWGANIKNMDIKVSATGQQKQRKYTVTPLPKAETLTKEQIEECKAIDLDKVIADGQRMSFYKPEERSPKAVPANEPGDDIVIEDIGEEPINLDDIPF